jgi:putative transcriptional regulator
MEWTPRRVHKLRQRLKLSQQDFGDRVGVRQATVSDWETGKTKPTGPSVKLLDMLNEETKARQ